ncbi:NAD(P)H-hydrate dehydratase [Candidatus Gottesmanbacteria bacterium]|nr:NAD(P)H-hydrate dehydratase [Candidatus Gottesmanbacteria bacterium]
MTKSIEDLINRQNARFYKLPLDKVKNRAGVGEVKALYQPHPTSQKAQNGQLTIIGGSSLFHGAALLSLITASRIVDMVFFSGPKEDKALTSKLKSSLYSFIWIPESDLEHYIEKSDAILIGPGMMRYSKELRNKGIKEAKNKIEINGEGKRTKRVTERLLTKFPQKQWIIDAGSLQTMDKKFIPKVAILTPNRLEFQMLFGLAKTAENLKKMAKEFQCIIINKAAEAGVYSGYNNDKNYNGYKSIGLPQPGLTKGGTGDVSAGLIAALTCKNDPFLAACAGTFLVKFTAKRLSEKMGNYYNADDLANALPETIKWCLDF